MDEKRILQAMAAVDKAEQNLRAVIVEASARGASVRELHRLTGLATATIQRWRRG